MKKINIGVIGCSAIAWKTVLPTIKQNPLFNLIMVGSRSVQKGKDYGEKFSCLSGTYEDVLNAKNIDAIYVSTPTGLHYVYGKQVLLAGKHLLLEKPFTDTLANSHELITLAERTGLVAMEGLAYVYHPYINKLDELLLNNEIGKIRLIEASFGFPFLDKTDIRNDKSLGGGAILDNLIYPLSISLRLLGTGYTDKSYKIHLSKEFDVDDRGFLRIDWGEYSANINYGFGFAYRNTFQIWGSEGSISIDRAFTKPATANAEILIEKQGQTNGLIIEPANQFQLMLDAFYNKIEGIDKSRKNEGKEILSRMEIISEMYQKSLGK